MMLRNITFAFVAVAFLTAGCADEFDLVTEVNKFRVMGVSVTPPEIRPEYTGPVDIQVLWHDPHGKGRSVEFGWVFCAGDVPTATGYQACELLDPFLLPPVIANAESGGDTFSIPMIPAEAYEDIPEGTSFVATAIVLMCAGGSLPPAEELVTHQDTNDINALCKGGDGISAYKSIVIANGNVLSDEPNANPQILSLSLDGALLTPVNVNDPDPHIPDDVTCSDYDCDADITLAASFSNESYQSYTILEFDEPKTEQERPYISWFATGGEFLGEHSVSDSPDDVPEVEWNPKEQGDYILWAVANDRRGGVSWQEFRVRVM
ncbi:MAG: hypothetical protein GY854_01085 [Deltaproteobacteria bacterium]|nr:hypothetical protein [Deltaproteobacteria bacterium]